MAMALFTLEATAARMVAGFGKAEDPRWRIILDAERSEPIPVQVQKCVLENVSLPFGGAIKPIGEGDCMAGATNGKTSKQPIFV